MPPGCHRYPLAETHHGASRTERGLNRTPHSAEVPGVEGDASVAFWLSRAAVSETRTSVAATSSWFCPGAQQDVGAAGTSAAIGRDSRAGGDLAKHAATTPGPRTSVRMEIRGTAAPARGRASASCSDRHRGRRQRSRLRRGCRLQPGPSFISRSVRARKRRTARGLRRTCTTATGA
jgi:hypothetical protein